MVGSLYQVQLSLSPNFWSEYLILSALVFDWADSYDRKVFITNGPANGNSRNIANFLLRIGVHLRES